MPLEEHFGVCMIQMHHASNSGNSAAGVNATNSHQRFGLIYCNTNVFISIEKVFKHTSGSSLPTSCTAKRLLLTFTSNASAHCIAFKVSKLSGENAVGGCKNSRQLKQATISFCNASKQICGRHPSNNQF